MVILESTIVISVFADFPVLSQYCSVYFFRTVCLLQLICSVWLILKLRLTCIPDSWCKISPYFYSKWEGGSYKLL
jgi:hypothetical protein